MKITKKWKRSIYKRLLELGLVSPKVVALLDGGICSQMHQFILGHLYEEKGYKVEYDLSFYDEFGVDLNNRFVRNFDLLKAFPYLSLKKASKSIVKIYKLEYFYRGNNTGKRIDDFSFLEMKPPLYLGGYYHLPAKVWLPAFKKLFRLSPEVLDLQNNEICTRIDKYPSSVAVHVRRGDLKVELFDYGKPATNDYFENAIHYLKENTDSPYFFFFSDEPEWVEKELIPALKLSKSECEVLHANGSDRGYMDLYLIAHCKHQITSKGTLGKYGALLMDNPSKIVILCDDEIEYMWKDLLNNPVFV